MSSAGSTSNSAADGPSSKRRELRKGLARTRRYLLSHHEPEEWDRCYAPAVRGRTVRLCARCSGVYPGLAAGLALFASGAGRWLWPALVVAGPAPALVDWAATLGGRSGSNAVRTATGFALGAAYALALAWLLTGGPVWLLAVGVAYGAIAAAALARVR